jgi:hypothetical protein
MGEPDELGEVCHAAKLVAQVVKYHSHVSLPEHETENIFLYATDTYKTLKLSD